MVGHEQGGERRALVVSYEPLHSGQLALICPITAARSEPRYSGEVAIPVGEAGQTRPGVILCHQLRCVSLLRTRSLPARGSPLRYVTNPEIRQQVRRHVARLTGLDIPGRLDGASRDESYQ